MGQTVSGQLKEWAKPTADGVQFPFSVTVTSGLPNVTLVPLSSTRLLPNSNALPALRDPIIGTNSGNWLIVSGSLGGFHDFTNNFNTSIYVYNPATGQIYSELISSTNLPSAVTQQLSSMDTNFLQDGDTLYIIGGYYNTPSTNNYTTLQTITSINIPGMINAVINNNPDLAAFVNYNNTSYPQFKVTGGQLGKIGNNFYLSYGQDCEGNYCIISQVYTNSIYEFSTGPTLASVTFLNTVTHGDLDGSGWRRRDYALVPFMQGSTETLFAMGGPFTPGNDALVWTNGISFDVNINFNDSYINQQANQYLSPHLSMYSASQSLSYEATFSGLSNLYWTTSGLGYNNSTPYGNILDLISSDASGNTQEYANLQPLCSGQPLASCEYMGLAGHFIPAGSAYDSRGILQLDQLSQNSPTLIGYVYGGLVSPVPEIFVTPDPTSASNQVYGVYVTPAGSGAVSWQNITNMYAGN
jgi:hypothetical protein